MILTNNLLLQSDILYDLLGYDESLDWIIIDQKTLYKKFAFTFKLCFI